MYTEEYEKKGFPILGTILKVIIVGIIILLLILFIPKIFFTNKKNNENSNKEYTDNCSEKYGKQLDALTSQIFSDNLDKMKEAAISYYTTERLPQNDGDSEKMTLSDMIGKKIIVALIDKNNKAVDVEKSYVKISKVENEYILKVNIKDSEKEDYILVHLGCYSYCKTDICEKATVKQEVKVKDYKPTPVIVVKNDDKEQNDEKYSCEYKNGKYYDKEGNSVSELTYLIICEAPACKKVNGYYFDRNGKNVTKYTYEKDCIEKPKPISYKCEYKNSKYYDENGKIVSEEEYLISCEKPKCKEIDGYYFGKDGKSVSKKTYEDECIEKPSYKCEYKNGKYYNAKGKVVSKVNYLISCEKPKCKEIDGYYFGKDGKSVSKKTYEDECIEKPSYKCEYKNGKYYNAKGKEVSKVNYLISCEKPKCKEIDGYYFGKDGKSVSKKTYEDQCIEKPSYKCEYKNGKYYDANGKVVSKVNYLISCEKPKCKVIDGYYFGKDGKSVSKKTYEDQCIEKPSYKCEYKNGKYYDANGKVVSKVNYLISCEKPKCKEIDGYYFGKDGKSVSKKTYEDQCIEKPSYKCEYKNGKYYDAKGKVVSKVNYLISCEKPKCKVIDGYYFGKDGKSVSKSTYEKECKAKEYLYEYKKTTATKFSKWTEWSSWQKTDCSTKEINCNDSDINCLSKLQMYKRKEKIGTYNKTYTKTRNILKQTGSYIEKSCSKYNYIEINKTLYATKTTTIYTTINKITPVTQATTGDWKYNGRASYSNPPKDTNKTHYKFVGADYSYCEDTCTSLPNYYYDSYTYTGKLTNVTSTTVPGDVITGKSATTTTEYKASCGEYTYKTIPIYSTISVTEKDTRVEPLYGNVCYQSTKTRKITEKGTTKTKWSSYNDKELLNNGWTYTGQKKLK